jgi:TrmH family RNA methyltransferase
LFLAEGPQATREALTRPDLVAGVFATAEATARHRRIITAADEADVPVWPITEQGLAALSDTVTPQGLVALCRHLHVGSVPELPVPRLAVVLAGVADPGNAGTVLRTADAAGATAVIFPEGSVDPYNGKCVRASAGSLFHVDLVRGGSTADAVAALRAAGLTVLAADAYGSADLDELADAGGLERPTAWLFGAEAHGLPQDVAALADTRVKVPIHGRAESLNLAAAAAVCLYASARALRPRRSARAAARAARKSTVDSSGSARRTRGDRG